MEYKLRCTKCMVPANDYSSFRCRKCNSILEVSYDYKTLKLPEGFSNMKPRSSKYLPFLPVESLDAGLGEGGTPLVRNESSEYGDTNLLFKLETKNPTRSFKDRGSAVEITKALELGFTHVACASTGNMGISIAHYAKKAGIKATIFISKDGNQSKIKTILKYGASVVKVSGDFNDALREAEIFANPGKVFLCGDYHYREEGQKTVMFEVLDQLRHRAPDFLVLPVGNATLLSAAYKGMNEYKQLGLIDSFPKIIAVQSSGSDPLVKAFNRKEKITYSRSKTIADAIAVGYPTFGSQAINALKGTKGMAIRVPDGEILNAMQKLSGYGIGAEPGGAAGFAGFMAAYKSYREKFKDKTTVVVITGNNEKAARKG